MTAAVIVHCDGTPTDRPGMALERCRAFLPTRHTDVTAATGDAVQQGWRWHTDGRHLCPACARGGQQ